MKYWSQSDMGICIQGFMLRCEDILSMITVAIIVVEKLTNLQN